MWDNRRTMAQSDKKWETDAPETQWTEQYQSTMTTSPCWHQRQWELHWGSPSARRQWRFSPCISQFKPNILHHPCDSVHLHNSQVFRKRGNHQSLKLNFFNITLGCKIIHWCHLRLPAYGALNKMRQHRGSSLLKLEFQHKLPKISETWSLKAKWGREVANKITLMKDIM